MPTWPSPRSEQLSTPANPAIRFTRGTYFGASRFACATACQVARPPSTDQTRSPQPQRAITSRLPAGRSPFLPLDITTTGPELLLLAGLPPARMAASLAAPDPDVQFSRTRFLVCTRFRAGRNRHRSSTCLLFPAVRLTHVDPAHMSGMSFLCGLRAPVRSFPL
jgi:hypothetical protein